MTEKKVRVQNIPVPGTGVTRDVEVQTRTIQAEAMIEIRGKYGVKPLDLLVTADILAWSKDLLAQVQKERPRRTSTTVNLLHAFLDIPEGSELYDITKPSDVMIWLGDYCEHYGVDFEDHFGGSTYQNMMGLIKSGYLKPADKEDPFDQPAISTPPLGVAYLCWHDEISTDAFLSFLITGTTGNTGIVPADTSDTFKTAWQINNSDFYSAHLINDPGSMWQHIHHLSGVDANKFARNLAGAVFSKNARRVWESMGTAQLDFLKFFVNQQLPVSAASEVYLNTAVMPVVDDPRKLFKALASLIYDNKDEDPSIAKMALNELEEEICRTGWLMLKAAGDELTGYNWAQEYWGDKDTTDQKEQLSTYKDNVDKLIDSFQGITYSGEVKFGDDLLDNMDEVSKAQLLERAQRAFQYLKTGDVMNLIDDEEFGELSEQYYIDSHADFDDLND